MNPMLDILAGVLFGATAVCLFGIHALSCPKRAPKLPNLPGYLRTGIWLTSASFMVRSVNLLTLSARPPETPGHVNLAAFVAAALLCYTVMACMVWIGSALKDAHSAPKASEMGAPSRR